MIYEGELKQLNKNQRN